MNTYYKINGGKKLSGEISTKGAKNSAVVLLAASLLNKKTSTFYNMPKIEEVYRLLEVLNSIGVKTDWIENNTLKITPPEKIRLEDIDEQAAIKTRSIILFIGALININHEFKLPITGGCKLGKRTVTPHFYALEKFGIKINTTEKNYEISVHNPKAPEEIILYESGDTVTENAIMAVALSGGTTTIKYASANYQIQDLCFFLEKLGVKIDGIGTTTLTIHGVNEISTDIKYHISEDPIESMLFISIAATTNSEIIIKRCPINFLELELYKLEKMGFKYEVLKKYKSENGKTNLVDIKTKESELTAPAEKIHPNVYPGLNMDNLPFFVPIATQAKGETLIHDWVYENRAIYYIELQRLGAKVMLADPHRAFITGPTKLKAAQVVAPPALRPSAIIMVAMLAATGTSVLQSVYGIERGYENLVERLKSIGADIERIEE